MDNFEGAPAVWNLAFFPPLAESTSIPATLACTCPLHEAGILGLVLRLCFSALRRLIGEHFYINYCVFLQVNRHDDDIVVAFSIKKHYPMNFRIDSMVDPTKEGAVK
jgi:hypothetical protein